VKKAKPPFQVPYMLEQQMLDRKTQSQRLKLKSAGSIEEARERVRQTRELVKLSREQWDRLTGGRRPRE
jgi:hypothetical protein